MIDYTEEHRRMEQALNSPHHPTEPNDPEESVIRARLDGILYAVGEMSKRLAVLSVTLQEVLTKIADIMEDERVYLPVTDPNIQTCYEGSDENPPVKDFPQ